MVVAQHGLPQPAVEPRLQFLLATEDHVRGPFVLIGGPVVPDRQPAQVLGVQRVGQLAQGIQLPRPIGLTLLVEQLLRPLPVADPHELVVTADIAQPRAVHLPRQPFPAVEADLHLEGEPGLPAHVQPAEQWIVPGSKAMHQQ